jgi:hypothetical protein
MSKGVRNFGLDPSELEESQSVMPTIYPHWKVEGVYYRLVDTSSNPIRGQRLDFTCNCR